MTRYLFSLITAFTLFTFALAMAPQTAFAHNDAEPIWAMDKVELAKLQGSIERHRIELLNALDDAAKFGVDADSLQRPYRLDSNKQVVDIPRSVLNRVIMASLNLETESTKMYLFCETGCERSLFRDLTGHPKQKEAVGIIRGLWPKLKASFAILWHDIPVGVWMRTINLASYSRSIGANMRYQAKAYGGLSMTAGAAGFGVAFTVTEIAESMFMGPLHFVCKANYFWSVAFGTAIASLSRDLKTLLLFEKNGKSIFSRVIQAFSNFSSLHAARQIEKRVLFQSLVGPENIDTFEKLTKRDAQSSVLEPLLDKVSAKQAVASDQMLWSELAWELKNPAEQTTEIKNREKLFETELVKIFDASAREGEPARRWQDLNASLRVMLRIFRNDVEIRHQIERKQSPALKTLGQLDAQLRRLDLFMMSWLSKKGSLESAATNRESAAWLKNILGEWLALSIETSGPKFEIKAIEIRLDHLKAILEASVRKGESLGIAPEGYRDMMISIEKSRPITVRSCEALFISVR